MPTNVLQSSNQLHSYHSGSLLELHLAPAISEWVYDLINNLLLEKEWDRKTLYSPHIHLLEEQEQPDKGTELT